MKLLEADIKNKRFKQMYLFYGEEEYLKNKFLEMIEKQIFPNGKDLINIDVFEGKACSVEGIINAVETVSLFTEYRLIIIRDSALFITGRKNDTQNISEALKDVSGTTVIVFMEREVDKRNGLYKLVAKEGKAMEFSSLKEGDLVNWTVRNFNKLNISIDSPTALYFIKSVSTNMESILNETQKLYNYVDKEVKKADIDKICTKSLETKIFELIGAVGEQNTNKALQVYSNLMLMKESPIMVLSMIARQFRIILQVKATKSDNSKEIATELALHSFVVSEAMKQGRNFPVETLIEALKDCLKADVDIKSGKMNDKLAVEMLIIKYSEAKIYR